MLNIEDFYDLEKRGLVISRHTDNKVLFKYHNSVFYNNLWDESPLLLEARGIVFDKNTGAILQRPFHKIFNVGENGQEEPQGCVAYRKVNGFMCAATVIDDKLFVTTTGSMDSDYQKLAYKWVDSYIAWDTFREHITYLFEICDDSDPHIVPESSGIYFLSARYKNTGEYMSKGLEWHISYILGCKCALPGQDSLSEGWVYYDDTSGAPIAKTKTPHYLSKKALMRMGKKQTGIMFNNSDEFRKRLDEEFFNLFDHILLTYTHNQWLDLNEQDRRAIIEEYFNE